MIQKIHKAAQESDRSIEEVADEVRKCLYPTIYANMMTCIRW